MEEEVVTKAHSRVLTSKVTRAAKEAGGEEFRACVIYCLLVNKRWFKKQAMLELYDADLHNLRATGAEMLAKKM
jgi:hypothetical protein